MKYHYGYTGKIPDLPPNKNMDLLLQELMAEAQWEEAQKAVGQEGPDAEDNGGFEDTEEQSEMVEVPSSHPYRLFSQLSSDILPDSRQDASAHRRSLIGQTTASDYGEKHWVDKKI